MTTITYDRITVDNREVPASFHDALLKLKDATAKQVVSLASWVYYLPGRQKGSLCNWLLAAI
jgi:hypothetical protein